MGRSFASFTHKHPDYLLLMALTLLSGIGSTLTSLAIYRELARLGANGFLFATAFAVTILPGLVSSQLAAGCLRRFNVSRIMVIVELTGAATVVLPWLGAYYNNAWLLLGSLPIASATAGFLIPFTSIYVRSNFNDDEMLAVAEISNLMLVFDFLFGTLLGTLIIETAGITSFFVFDIATYIIAALAIFWLCKKYPSSFVGLKERDGDDRKFSWSTLTPRQKRGFSLYPILAAACSPCTALLPNSGAAFGLNVHIGLLVISPTLLLILCKTNGQFLGPMLVRKFHLEARISDDRLIIICLAAFLAFYLVVFTTTSLPIAACSVVAAHIFSNIVFMLSYVAFQRNFLVDEIGPASVRQFQIGGIVIAISSVVCGSLAGILTNLVAVGFGVVGLIVSAIILIASKSRDDAKVGSVVNG